MVSNCSHLGQASILQRLHLTAEAKTQEQQWHCRCGLSSRQVWSACLSKLSSKRLQLCLFLQQLSFNLPKGVSCRCGVCGMRWRVHCLDSVLHLVEPAVVHVLHKAAYDSQTTSKPTQHVAKPAQLTDNMDQQLSNIELELVQHMWPAKQVQVPM